MAVMNGSLFCTHCGLKNEASWDLSTGSLAPCTKCLKPIVSVVELLLELKLVQEDTMTCPRCNRATHFARFCYACGEAVKK